MENIKIVKRYFKKHFAHQFYTEMDSEFKDLLKILNKKDKEALNKPDFKSWVSCSEKLPTVEENGQKVLIYRIMNDSQASLAISIHETSLVKHCDVNETWWMELPRLTFL